MIADVDQRGQADLVKERLQELRHRRPSVASRPAAPDRGGPPGRHESARADALGAEPGGSGLVGQAVGDDRADARARVGVVGQGGEPGQQHELVDRQRSPALVQVQLREGQVQAGIGRAGGEGDVAGIDGAARLAGGPMAGGGGQGERPGQRPGRRPRRRPRPRRWPAPDRTAVAAARSGSRLGRGGAGGGPSVGLPGDPARPARPAGASGCPSRTLEARRAPRRPPGSPDASVSRVTKPRMVARRLRDSASSRARRAASAASGRRPAASSTAATRSNVSAAADRSPERPAPRPGRAGRPRRRRPVRARHRRRRAHRASCPVAAGRVPMLDERQRSVRREPAASPYAASAAAWRPAARRRGRDGGRPCSARRALHS